ncbi:hypothetical protein J6S35_03145 [Candidatus Saccharibacteria bacterium]|nr:hypothetical protein [Candidatus Saccharibacteria bacterium]
MNKDVVYIEPEDDITDIIARVKNSKQKLVALVPPKKIGVLRSAVNTKLIAKTAKASGKVVVIVTTDSSLVKLAASAQIPVAKTLQSRPKLPSEIIKEERAHGEQFIDEKDFDDEEFDPNNSVKPNKPRPVAQSTKKPDQEISSDDIEKDEEKTNKSDKKPGKNGKNIIPTLEKYRKWIIIGAGAFVLLIIFLVWAFAFAPGADIAVAIRTTANNFSENVSFVTKSGTENTSDGKFLLEQKKVEKTSSVEFQATGQKDIGEKAHGTLKVSYTFTNSTQEGFTIPAGSTFSSGSATFTSNSAISFENPDGCTRADYSTGKCVDTKTAELTATAPGDQYNVAASSSWSSPNGTSASNTSAFSGGTSNVVTVVSDDDFKKAKEKLESQGREDGKSELVKEFGDDMIVIESSLEVSTSDPKSSPAVNEEVKSGTTPKIEATTTFTMYAVDKVKVEDYIKEKASMSLANDQRIYAVNKPFFENFSKVSDGNYTAKLKSSTETGPKVSEEDILEKSKGKKFGEVQSILKSINGVSSVKLTPSFPWVSTVPNDPNKITIELKVEE